METPFAYGDARPRPAPGRARVSDEELAIERVLATHLLAKRAGREPNYAAEAHALHRMARALRSSPRAALDALVVEGAELCSADGNVTTGVSLLEGEGANVCFRWTAMAGRLAAAVGGTTPRGFSPCGVCLDQDRPVLFQRPDTCFTYFLETGVPFVEGLVLPFYVDGRAAGTIWIVSHDDSWDFDREDVRIMSSLAEFAGIAYSAIRTRETLAEAARERADLLAAERTLRNTAESASRAKNEFLALVSHELRTPLNAIDGYAELLEMGLRGPVSEAQLADLRRIRANEHRLLTLVNQLLDHAQIEHGTAAYDIQPINTTDVVRSCLDSIAPQARAKGVRCTFTPGEPATARADLDKVNQIVLNLLTNALKFTERGGRITVSTAARGDAMRVSVSDSGCGVPLRDRGRIFEPFVQSGARRRRPHQGVGLGLAISREYARGMGGDLELEHSSGAGSTFTLVLPLARRAD